MKKTISAFSVTLLSLFTACAFAIPPKPAACPSTNAVKTSVVKESDGNYNLWEVVYQPSTYATQNEWQFAFLIDATDKKDAEAKAKIALATLSGSPIMGYDKDYGKWGCGWKNVSKPIIAATAITPPEQR